jgi:DNA-binding PadR family transcriptional regulator
MSAAMPEKKQVGGSPLRGALLALLVSEGEQPLGGYRLGTLVERRLGPAWRVTRQSVYGTLDRLEEDGLICSSVKEATGRVGEGQRVYSATERAEAAVAAWMETPVSKEPMRAELQAKIAMSSPRHAPQLLRALDDYERDCFAMLRKTQEAEVPMSSWGGLAMNLTRMAVDESLQAELRWIVMARRWIAEFVADQSKGRMR